MADLAENLYPVVPEKPLGSNPFPGLRPFDEKDADLFFGRTEQQSKLIDRLSENRFLAVIGVSGSGKSSLVRAGLIPPITRGCLDSFTNWRIARLRPGDKPVASLATALVEPFRETGEDASQLEKLLRSGGETALLDLAYDHLDRDCRLLIFVDQFEELFRFKEPDESSTIRRRAVDDAADFVRLLLTALGHDDLYAVITMRSDYLGDCAQFRGLPEEINKGQYLIPRLTPEEQMEIIQKPIWKSGADISSDLVERLIRDLGSEPQQLPILQHVLMRIWMKHFEKHANDSNRILDRADYEDVGSFKGALNKHADAIYGELGSNELGGSKEHQWIAQRLFRRITIKDRSDRVARRPATLKDIYAITGAQDDNHKKLVQYVVRRYQKDDCNFLAPFDQPRTTNDENTMVDITHESLCELWTQLRTWVEDEAESADRYRIISTEAGLHEVGKRGFCDHVQLNYVLRRYHPLKSSDRDGWNQTWSKRYNDPHKDVDEYKRVVKYLRDSRSHHRRFKFVALAIVFVLLASAWHYRGMNLGRRIAEVRAQNASIQKNGDSLEREALLTLASWNEMHLDDSSDIARWEEFSHLESESGPTAQLYKGITNLLVTTNKPYLIASRQDSPPVLLNLPDLKVDSLIPRNTVAVTRNGRLIVSQCGKPDSKGSGSQASNQIVYVKCRPGYSVIGADESDNQKSDNQKSGSQKSGNQREPRIIAIEVRSRHDVRAVPPAPAGYVTVMDAGGKPKATLELSAEPTVVALSPDGNFVALGQGTGPDMELQLFALPKDVPTPASNNLKLIKHFGNVTPTVVFVPKKNLMAVGGQHGEVWVYNLDKRQLDTTLSLHMEVSALNVSEDLLAIGLKYDESSTLQGSQGPASEVRVISLDDYRMLWRKPFRSPINRMIFGPTGKWLALALGDNTVRIRDAHKGLETARLVHPPRSQAGSGQTSTSWLRIFNSQRPQAVVLANQTGKAEEPSKGDISAVAFDSNEEHLYFGTYDGVVGMAMLPNANDTPPFKCLANNARLGEHLLIAECPEPPQEVQSSGENRPQHPPQIWLLDSSTRGEISCWPAQAQIEANPTPPCILSINPGADRRNVTAAWACGPQWTIYSNHSSKPVTGKLTTPSEPGSSPSRPPTITAVEVSPRLDAVAFADSLGRVQIQTHSTGTDWNIAVNCRIPYKIANGPAAPTGNCELEPSKTTHDGPVGVSALTSSPRSDKFLVGSVEGDIWEVTMPSGRAGAQIVRLASFDARVESLAFSPDERNIAVGSDGRAYLIEEGRVIKKQPESIGSNRDSIRAFAFSQDQNFLASLDQSGRVVIFDLAQEPFYSRADTWMAKHLSNADLPPLNIHATLQLADEDGTPVSVYDVRFIDKLTLQVAASERRVGSAFPAPGQPQRQIPRQLVLSTHKLGMENRSKEVCKRLSPELFNSQKDNLTGLFREVCPTSK